MRRSEKVMLSKKSKYWLGVLSEPLLSDDSYKEHLEELVDSGKLQYFRFLRKRKADGLECINILLSFDNFIDVAGLHSLIPFGFTYNPQFRNIGGADSYVCKKENRISGPYSYGHLELPKESVISRLMLVSCHVSNENSKMIIDFVRKVFANRELADFLTYF